MSVDDRLRAAFGETDRSWDEQVPDALAAVRARRRQETAVRRGAGAALVAAAAVATVAVTVSQRDDMSPTPAEDPTSPASVAAEPNPLDGTWVSEPLTRSDVRRAARLAGDANDAAAMLAELPATPFRVALYVNGDRSSVHAVLRVDGQTEETTDEENMSVSGNRVVMQPMFDDGENVHTYVLEGGTLRFAFVSTTEGEVDGVSAEAWQRLVYDTAAFTPGA